MLPNSVVAAMPLTRISLDSIDSINQLPYSMQTVLQQLYWTFLAELPAIALD